MISVYESNDDFVWLVDAGWNGFVWTNHCLVDEESVFESDVFASDSESLDPSPFANFVLPANDWPLNIRMFIN